MVDYSNEDIQLKIAKHRGICWIAKDLFIPDEYCIMSIDGVYVPGTNYEQLTAFACRFYIPRYYEDVEEIAKLFDAEQAFVNIIRRGGEHTWFVTVKHNGQIYLEEGEDLARTLSLLYLQVFVEERNETS